MVGVSWHDSGRWFSKIGYTHTKKGTRTRAFFYFNGAQGSEPPTDVIADVTNKKREWAEIEKNWDQIRPLLEADARISNSKLDFAKPVWFDRAILREMDADDLEAIKDAEQADAEAIGQEAVADMQLALERGALTDSLISSLRAAGVLPKGILAPSRTVTIREAIQEYLKAQKERIGRKIGDRIEIGTFNTSRNNLLLCLGCDISKDWKPAEPLKGEQPWRVDLNRPLVSLDNRDLKTIADHWFNLPGDVTSRRTVKNYFGGLRTFLNWCDLQEDFGFARPKAMAKILQVTTSNETVVTEANYELLKTCLVDAAERTKIYAVLGMFCGFNQADICKMTTDEVATLAGETYITGYRSKEDAETKAKTKIKCTHWIPSEIAELMRKHQAAAKNKHSLYFLNKHGSPMFHEALEGGKTNAVTKAWEKVMAAHPAPTFKHLRKWGWNEIQLHADTTVDIRCVGEVMAKRWSGQQGGGVSASYRFDDYRPVIAAQQKWWKVIGKAIGF
jgi:integrase